MMVITIFGTFLVAIMTQIISTTFRANGIFKSYLIQVTLRSLIIQISHGRESQGISKLTIEDFKYALSSRYQHTPYDPYSDLGTDAERHAYRPIGFQRNQELHILQIRNDVPAKLAGICWLSYGPNAYNATAPYYTNVLDTPDTYKTTEDFNITKMYWLTHAITTIGDDHPKRYNNIVEDMKQNTIAAGRHVVIKTDQEAANLTGEELQKKLQDANSQTAQAAYNLAMKCFGEMVKTGTLAIRLNY